MKSDKIIEKAAISLNLPYKDVWLIYLAYWQYVREYISSVPLKGDITEEEFNKLRTSVNIPSLGKFYVDWDKLKNKKEINERHKNKKIKTIVHNSNNNS